MKATSAKMQKEVKIIKEKIISLVTAEYREHLRKVHAQLQEAMLELIEKKNYSEAERLLLIVDKQMLTMSEDVGGLVVRDSSDEARIDDRKKIKKI